MLAKSLKGKSSKFPRPLSKRFDDGNVININNLHKLNPNNVSAWNMKRLMNMVRHGALTTLDEQKIDSANNDENATQIRSENKAKADAKKIFQDVVSRGCKLLLPSFIVCYIHFFYNFNCCLLHLVYRKGIYKPEKLKL